MIFLYFCTALTRCYLCSCHVLRLTSVRGDEMFGVILLFSTLRVHGDMMAGFEGNISSPAFHVTDIVSTWIVFLL
jgi:hypothetical protein